MRRQYSWGEHQLTRKWSTHCWIIDRDGDPDGMRRQPWYLGKLVEEAIIENEFSLYTMARCLEIQARREAAAACEN